MVEQADMMAESAQAKELLVAYLVRALLNLEDSKARYLLAGEVEDVEVGFMREVVYSYERESDEDADSLSGRDEPQEDEDGGAERFRSWQQWATRLNDRVMTFNPLIGREQELERTMQVLCRRDKNNPLHVGEPGVGKTALVRGLVARICEGRVPDRLASANVYELDLGAILAGAQFRGDLEKRLKLVMEEIRKEGNAIIYIDEIHNLVGAGQAGESSMDASNFLKPYMDGGEIRFIGSTTYEEYNKYLARSKGIVRRFQQIDIHEPSVEEAIAIVEGLQKRYEDFHNVTYEKGVAEHIVRQSAKLISDRFLPDKAIDLMDEAGACVEMREGKDVKKVVDRKLVDEVLMKVCKIDAAVMADDDGDALATLRERILARVYGQDKAVASVVEAVQMAKAGLAEDSKPLAALLFVGPTGVGKTEVARVLAQELGIALQRFDMSEYTEKHTVAKLIGSPAGYVGYEDGGLLTDAIKKTPNCVLLLDEIEKAHQDIYNILLQVMDYAVLTDNKGRKADFRNVILIMTSNAGAQYAAQASVGFDRQVTAGEAMLRQVKRTFKPEFINRLTGTVVFRDMDEQMAGMILDKKLRELQAKLTARHVSMTLTEGARNLLLGKGYSREYGAREMDRIIAAELKPLLMREMLFGRLKQGGNVTVAAEEHNSSLTIDH